MFNKAMARKVFTAADGTEYGPLREVSSAFPEDLDVNRFQPFAEDECGNYFVIVNGKVAFWDHETGDVNVIAYSTENFSIGLHEPQSVTLKESQVKCVWVDPDFLKELGLEQDQDE